MSILVFLAEYHLIVKVSMSLCFFCIFTGIFKWSRKRLHEGLLAKCCLKKKPSTSDIYWTPPSACRDVCSTGSNCMMTMCTHTQRCATMIFPTFLCTGDRYSFFFLCVHSRWSISIYWMNVIKASVKNWERVMLLKQKGHRECSVVF